MQECLCIPHPPKPPCCCSDYMVVTAYGSFCPNCGGFIRYKLEDYIQFENKGEQKQMKILLRVDQYGKTWGIEIDNKTVLGGLVGDIETIENEQATVRATRLLTKALISATEELQKQII